MDGQIEEWMNGQMEGWMDEGMDRWMDVDKTLDRWKSGMMDRSMEARKDG